MNAIQIITDSYCDLPVTIKENTEYWSLRWAIRFTSLICGRFVETH